MILYEDVQNNLLKMTMANGTSIAMALKFTFDEPLQ
jgi:hypothetical protein